MSETSISLWALISNASLLVQAVMLILVSASFASWVVIYLKAKNISANVNALDSFEEAFWSGRDLRQFYGELLADPNLNIQGIENIFLSGFDEFDRQEKMKTEPEAVLEGTARRMRIALSGVEDRLSALLPFLATVGSISPYVGLFGTVWGIMNSFRSLAGATQVSIISVAPGISEALVATAMGLLAAIPAVIAYNRLSDRVDRIVVRYESFIDEFIGILHRKVHSSVKDSST